MKYFLNFVYCIAINEVFACIASAPSLLLLAHHKHTAEETQTQTIGGGGLLCMLAAVSVLIQAVVFLHASGVVLGNQRTERFFDLTGSLTFLSLTGVAVHLQGGVGALSLRQQLLSLCVVLWAARLGSFLFARIQRHGGVDNRFTAIKPDLNRFARFWGIQGIWVFVTALPVFLALALPPPSPSPSSLTVRDVLGLLLWLLGFSMEVAADRQKAAWKDKSRFINTGLWAVSRHPNYFGEITLWVGVCVCASSSFSHPCHYVCLLSPLLVALLLVKVSGIPLLEKMAAEKFRDDPQYKAYKASVPVLIPFVGRAGDATF